MGGIAQRTDDVGHVVANVEIAQLGRRKTNLLYNKHDGAALQVGAGYGEWHTLAFFAHTDDNEVARLAALGYQRGFNL